MKLLRVALLGLGVGFSIHIGAAQPAASPAKTPDSAASSTADNAKGDAEWQAILKNAKPPAPPAEWNNKAPNAEQMNAFKKESGAAAEKLADRIKLFAETYPTHPKADEARAKEKVFRQQAKSLIGASETGVAAADKDGKSGDAARNDSKPEKAKNPAYEAKLAEVMERLKAARPQGMMAQLGELESGGRALVKEFPAEMEPWQMLMEVAKYSQAAKELSIYQLMAELAPDERLKKYAEDKVRALDRIGKPAVMAFKAQDGRDVDIAKMRGKVVLLDFWATWCGPCVAELPNLKKVYEELHEAGFEILGVSGDEDCDTLATFVKKNKMPWPQVCDKDLAAKSSILREYGIGKFPTMYLVDKKGNIRDMDARQDLEEKVRNLLKEQD
jgi:peroxiredoxin